MKKQDYKPYLAGFILGLIAIMAFTLFFNPIIAPIILLFAILMFSWNKWF
ncbi:hypothetical protein J4405_06125 [Candidatus Woesearchaeota archaeon]|nr:hypothetical protein [Candidatus Woesearchaeota archaeon]